MGRTGQTSAVTLIVSALVLALLVGAAIPLFSGDQGGPARDPAWTPPPRTATPTRGVRSTRSPQSTVPSVAAQAASVTPTRTQTLIRQNTTAPATLTPTATSVPTRADATRVAPAVTASPTLELTSTPTQAPSATPTSPPVPTATPLATPTQAIVALPPDLTEPPNGTAAQGVINFRWQPNGPLPPGAGYEVVWWNPDEPPQAARGLAAPTQALSLAANIDVLFTANQVPGGRFFWTVLVVSQDPYIRLTQPEASPPHIFIHQSQNLPAPPRP